MTHPFEQRTEVAEDYCLTCGYLKCQCHPEGCICTACALDDLIVRANQHMQRLNATRDTIAIRASVANTKLLLSEITMAQGRKP